MAKGTKLFFLRKDLLLALTASGITLWELIRVYFKNEESMIRLERMQEEPIPIPMNIKDRMKELRFKRLSLSGKFNHKSELYLNKRRFITDHIMYPPYKDRHLGINVVTPFYCNELGMNILVNRGWVPKQLKDPSTRELGQVEGERAIVGVVQVTENKVINSNRPDLNKWENANIEQMAQASGTEPILIDCTYESSSQGGPIGGQTAAKVPFNKIDFAAIYGIIILIISGAFFLKISFVTRIHNCIQFNFRIRKIVAKDCR